MENPHKLVNGVRVDLTTKEIQEMEQRRLDHEAQKVAIKYKQDRIDAYLAKGWVDPFDIFDDMAVRGIDVVLSERLTIRTDNPKPEGK